MAKLRKAVRDKKARMLSFRFIMEKLQRSLWLASRLAFNNDDETGEVADVPEDVKEGQFVVFAIDEGNLTRFIVELGYLNHPEFLKLLEQAEEEFGFEQKGALAVPCHPDDLRRILGSKRREGNDGMDWSSCNKATD
ncbi:PREDICTED: auxin-induced protein 10A5-like [Nelumbo nucifera]|uniref:Uncharacterized protein n=2 Tax=Nelumbo nucifera TaxID=4432 RepID=A0A822YB92_NELNU|nr:PREDICTED: auxin-induced protein 10A5-like [Nelumbo nucifera]DAD26808.1 TPA_asm: hypothetical protein HUJ06_028276 [Nelumbo nucifera]